jgi:predicted metal-binding membrane protein
LPKSSTISDRKAQTTPALTALFARESLPAWIALGTASLLAWIVILSLLAEFSGRRGRAIDLRLGLYHGMFCIACCWGLMLILLAVGVMDLPAMIGLAAVTCIEKLTPFGLQAGRLVGCAFIVTAVVISIWPSLLPIPGAYLCRAP